MNEKIKKELQQNIENYKASLYSKLKEDITRERNKVWEIETLITDSADEFSTLLIVKIKANYRPYPSIMGMTNNAGTAQGFSGTTYKLGLIKPDSIVESEKQEAEKKVQQKFDAELPEKIRKYTAKRSLELVREFKQRELEEQARQEESTAQELTESLLSEVL